MTDTTAPSGVRRGRLAGEIRESALGLLIDIATLAVVAAFAWAGSNLGLVRSSVRLVAALGAFGVAVLAQHPFSRLITAITPASQDFASLLSMLAIGAGTYLAVAAIVSYYSGWVPHERLYDMDRLLAAIPGAVLGIAWCTLMVALVLLMPADNFLSRGALSSHAGKVQVDQAPALLKWLVKTFPHYTQTLPKGTSGAVLKFEDSIPVHEDGPRHQLTDEAGRLLGNINQYRTSHDGLELQWNQEVAAVAARHSRAMFDDRFLGTTTPDGARLRDRMEAALGSNAGLYDHYGVRVVWAHSLANAFAALVQNSASRHQMLDEHFQEIGIGVVDGGWFDGRMYTITYIGRPLPTAGDTGANGNVVEDGTGGDAGSAFGGSATATTSTTPTTPTVTPSPVQ